MTYPATLPAVVHGTRIYDELKRCILTCELPPGTDLREQELAQRFDVSKSPVREALQHLVRDGLVTVMPRQGYRVSPISLTDARDMFTFRCALEVACIVEAAKNASDEQLKALDQFRHFSGTSEGDFIAYNRDFHCALARCSGNGRMTRATCDLIEEADRLTRMSVASLRGHNPDKLVEEHGAIITALQARNSRLAANLLKKHVTAAVKRFSAALEWVVLQA
ncbi:MAG: GntR family transcriptional regulator [Rhizobiales bacterium]|nr:GntR family transcriptional regulator [Hyphomicrobiales bacterium]